MQIGNQIINNGDWVHKSNFEFFGQSPVFHITSGVGKSKPGISKKGEEIPPKFVIRYNKHLAYYYEDALTVVSEEEALQMIADWEAIKVVESVKTNLATSCFRDDTGQPKQRINNEFDARKLAYRYMKKQPGNTFQPYKCVHCENFHIGKIGDGIAKDVLVNNKENKVLEITKVLMKNLKIDIFQVEHLYKTQGRIYCGQYDIIPEMRIFSGKWYNTLEIIPAGVESITTVSVYWLENQEGTKTTNIPPMDVFEYVLDKIMKGDIAYRTEHRLVLPKPPADRLIREGVVPKVPIEDTEQMGPGIMRGYDKVSSINWVRVIQVTLLAMFLMSILTYAFLK